MRASHHENGRDGVESDGHGPDATATANIVAPATWRKNANRSWRRNCSSGLMRRGYRSLEQADALDVMRHGEEVECS